MIRRLLPPLAPALVALLIFVALPMFWVLRTSFNELADGAYVVEAMTLDNYARFQGSPRKRA